ncbi:hypothetical protein V1517DRAFT_323930 [Lipomyces orientalis]|uniref:Uncharacterized protein n=1 Tax=Lipomyces orientalis TaxID=1233043 RepID=A0ACC3TMT9_9ASCO
MVGNYAVWPAVQFVNFRIIPSDYRLMFVNTHGSVLSALNNLCRLSRRLNTSWKSLKKRLRREL